MLGWVIWKREMKISKLQRITMILILAHIVLVLCIMEFVKCHGQLDVYSVPLIINAVFSKCGFLTWGRYKWHSGYKGNYEISIKQNLANGVINIIF